MALWNKPPAGFWKINVSGHSDEGIRSSAIGCLMRSRSCHFSCGYYGIVEYSEPIYTDLLAIYYGFKMADEENARYIEVESDSASAVYLVNNPNQNSEYSDILLNIRRLKDLAHQSCVLRYVERSSNLMAIRMSAYSYEKRVPITRLRNHWVLIVLCNPSNDLKGGGERPTMLLLDSLKGSVSGKIEGFIRGLLKSFYKYANSSPRNIDSIPFLIPEVPNQDDDKSCGFYVLFYTTQFLKMCPHTFNLMKDYPSFMSTTWFSDEDVEELRTGLLDLFQKESSGTRKRRSDMDMMRLIDACKSAGNNVLRSGRKNPKRQCVDRKRTEDVVSYMFLDSFIGRNTFSEREKPRLLPWNNYCLNKLEQILIQRSFLVDGELRAPNIDYTTLQSCRIKGGVDDDAFGRSTQNPDVEKTQMDFPKLSEEHCDKPDQGKIPRPCFEQGNHSEWMDQVSVDSENFVNEKHRLVDSLLASYQSVQQTFLLHMLYAKESDVPDEKMESIKKSFKEMNERANSALD
ncbi:hypothetical protein ACET3Z_031917 [Daucus carota]